MLLRIFAGNIAGEKLLNERGHTHRRCFFQRPNSELAIFSATNFIELRNYFLNCLQLSFSSAATFDYKKLEWLNGMYLRALAPDEYADRLVAYLREQGYEWDEALIRKAAPLVQEKIATLGEFPAFAGFLFARVEPDPAKLGDGPMLPAAVERLAEVDPFEAEPIEAALRELAEHHGLKPREAFQPIRLALTGSSVSPGLFESLELLGKDESLARLAGSGLGGASGSSAR